jgi:hypothetical protein
LSAVLRQIGFTVGTLVTQAVNDLQAINSTAKRLVGFCLDTPRLLFLE